MRLDELHHMDAGYISPKAIYVFLGDDSMCVNTKHYISPVVTGENTVGVNVDFRGGVTVTASRDEAYKFSVSTGTSSDYILGDVKWVDLMVISD